MESDDGLESIRKFRPAGGSFSSHDYEAGTDGSIGRLDAVPASGAAETNIKAYYFI